MKICSGEGYVLDYPSATQSRRPSTLARQNDPKPNHQNYGGASQTNGSPTKKSARPPRYIFDIFCTWETSAPGIYKYRVLPLPGNPRGILCLSRCQKSMLEPQDYIKNQRILLDRTTHFITPKVLLLPRISYKIWGARVTHPSNGDYEEPIC